MLQFTDLVSVHFYYIVLVRSALFAVQRRVGEHATYEHTPSPLPLVPIPSSPITWYLGTSVFALFALFRTLFTQYFYAAFTMLKPFSNFGLVCWVQTQSAKAIS
jgi:hypothetical protein